MTAQKEMFLDTTEEGTSTAELSSTRGGLPSGSITTPASSARTSWPRGACTSWWGTRMVEVRALTRFVVAEVRA